jgi:phosphomannomutase
MSIFKAYDIRGTYPEQLDENMAELIGRAAADYFKSAEFMVGTDDRHSRDSIFKAFTNGLMQQGVRVIDIGKVSTPVLYKSVADSGVDAGVMITASHNPGNYNGFKFCRRGAAPVPQDQLKEIEQLVLDKNFKDKDPTQVAIKKVDPFPAYKKFVSEHLNFKKKYKVVVDAGNAVCGLFAADIFALTSLEIDPMYFESDPSFPNHEPNPLEEKNTADLRKRVVDTNADLGIALDGDGDRVMLIDNKGVALSGDITTLLIALGLKEAGNSGFDVVIDCRSSWAVTEILEENGLSVTKSRVGHTFIKKLMREKGSLCGGELSGHYYFKSSSFTENTDIALFTILRMMESRDCTLEQLWKPCARYFLSGEINSKVTSVEDTINKVREVFAEGRFSEIDGLTVEFENWWFNLRPSNTEPLLRLNLEAKTEEELEFRKAEVLKVIREG